MVGFGSVGELYVEIGADISKLNAGIAAASAKIMGFERKFSSTGSKIGNAFSNSFSKVGAGLATVGTAAAVTGGILGVGLAVGAAKAASTFKDFESAVANAASVTGKVGAEFDAAKASISAVAMELGQKTAFSSAEAANAMYDLASAGYDVSNMVASDLQPMLNLAAGTQYDLSQTTATMASTLSQFGLGFESAGRLADTFAAAAGKTQANMEKLSYSMKYVGTIAHSASMGLEETTAALGLLYNAGLDGESAGTGLRGVLASLIAPTTKAAGVLKSMGLTIEDVNPTTKGFTNVIATLAAAGLDTNEAFDIFGREAAPAILALTSQSGELANLTTELQNAGGAAQTMADQQLDTLKGSLDALSGSIENVFISVGAALSPALRAVSDALNSAMPSVQEWATRVATSFSEFISSVVASQNSIKAIVGTVATAIGNIFRAITGGISGDEAGNAVSHFIGDLSSKVAEIVPKIESAIIGIIDFFKALVSGLSPTFDAVKYMVSDAIKVFQAFFSGISGSGSANTITGVVNSIATALSYLSGVVSSALVSIAPTIKNIFSSISDYISSVDWDSIWEKVSAGFEQLPFIIEGSVQKLTPAWELLKSAFEKAKTIISDIDFGSIWISIKQEFENLKPIFTTVIDALKPVWDNLKTVFNNGLLTIRAFVDGLSPTWANLKSSWDSVKTIWDQFKTSLTPAIQGFLDALGGSKVQQSAGFGAALAGVINILTGAIAGFLKYVAQHPQITEFVAAIVSMGITILSYLPGVIVGIYNFVMDVGTYLSGLIASVQTTATNWKAKWDLFYTAVSAVATTIWTTLQTWYTNLQNIYNNAVTSVATLKANIQAKWEEIKTAISTAATTIWTTLQTWYNNAQTVYNNAVSSLKTLYSNLSTTWNTIYTTIVNYATSIWTTLQGWYNNLQTVYNNVKAAVQSLLDGWRQKWDEIKTTVQQKGTEIITEIANIPTKIKEKATEFYEAGKAVVQKLIDGLQSKLQDVKNKVSEILSAGSVSGSANSVAKTASNSISNAGKWVVNSAETVAKKVADLFPHSPAKAGPFRKLPNWDAVFKDPMAKSIIGAKKLVTPISNMLSGIKNPIESASASVMRGSSVGYSRNETSTSKKQSQTISKGTNVKIGTVNNNGDRIAAAKMKRALGV